MWVCVNVYSFLLGYFFDFFILVWKLSALLPRSTHFFPLSLSISSIGNKFDRDKGLFTGKIFTSGELKDTEKQVCNKNKVSS